MMELVHGVDGLSSMLVNKHDNKHCRGNDKNDKNVLIVLIVAEGCSAPVHER